MSGFGSPNSIPNQRNNKAYWAAAQKSIEEQEKRMNFPGRTNPIGNWKPLNVDPSKTANTTPQPGPKNKQKPY